MTQNTKAPHAFYLRAIEEAGYFPELEPADVAKREKLKERIQAVAQADELAVSASPEVLAMDEAYSMLFAQWGMFRNVYYGAIEKEARAKEEDSTPACS